MCSKTPPPPPPPPAPVAYGYGPRSARYGYGYYGRHAGVNHYAAKRWRRSPEPEPEADAKADPEAGGHYAAPVGGVSCKIINDRVCRKVPVKTPRTISVPKCNKVPRTHCEEYLRPVKEQICNDVPVPACSKVARKVNFIIIWFQIIIFIIDAIAMA